VNPGTFLVVDDSERQHQMYRLTFAKGGYLGKPFAPEQLLALVGRASSRLSHPLAQR
jgi:DNA-binding response OmpR family regulator